MNRLTIVVMVLAALFVASCGEQTAKQGPSKEFLRIQDDVKTIGTQIGEITNCGDLAMPNLAIMGLRTDLENYGQENTLPDAELEQLNSMVDELQATLNGKWASLNCEEVMPEDELDTSGEEEGDYPD